MNVIVDPHMCTVHLIAPYYYNHVMFYLVDYSI